MASNRRASTRRASRKQRRASRKQRKNRKTSRREMMGGNYPSCSDTCTHNGEEYDEHNIEGVKSHAPMQALYKCKRCKKVCVKN